MTATADYETTTLLGGSSALMSVCPSSVRRSLQCSWGPRFRCHGVVHFAYGMIGASLHWVSDRAAVRDMRRCRSQDHVRMPYHLRLSAAGVRDGCSGFVATVALAYPASLWTSAIPIRLGDRGAVGTSSSPRFSRTDGLLQGTRRSRDLTAANGHRAVWST